MASIAFIGDCHLGYRHRFKTQRLRDYVRAFEDAIEKALELKPDVVVFTGDILHHPRPDPVSLRTALRGIMKAAVRCPVIVCIGNHEIEGHLGTTYSPIYADVHENIHVLTSEEPHANIQLGKKTWGFHGFEFTRNKDSASEKLKNISSNNTADVNVLCIHQAIEKYLSPHEISLALLREVAANFDLIVSGHVHKHQRIKEVFDVTPTFYCGSTERISFNEAPNKCGFMFFERDDFERPRFIRVSASEMTHVREDFTGTPAELNQRIEKLIQDNPAPLLKIEMNADLEGDFMDLRRDWADTSSDKTILEVVVIPKQTESEIQLERIELNEDLIREYFERSGGKNKELEDKCVELFERYAA